MYYQIFVQSFYDSNGDGIGDLNGVRAKLDYLVNLGIEGIWLMPINPSPSYHKYDVTDYYSIHPDYGSLADLRSLINEAHHYGLKVIIDLVISHCSSEHPWFLEACKNPQSQYRNYFIWATDDEIETMGTRTKEVSEDSDNVEQWNEITGQDEKYYSYFSRDMPDFNYDSLELRLEVHRIGRFWLREHGVDGFRLDAAKHIYPDNRIEDSQQFWVEFRKEMEQVNKEVFLIGEVWDNAVVVAPFLRGLKANFNFDLSNAITNAIQNEIDNGLIQKYLKIIKYYKSITSDFIDGTFIKNHDQNRILSVLGNNPAKAKMAASLLFTLPGTPFIYYGEEIGMMGLKPDEFVREPFVWSESDPGQTSWMESKYNIKDQVQPVEQQINDPKSFFNHYKTLIQLRKNNPVLSKGNIESLTVENRAICAFKRFDESCQIEVYHNLSRKSFRLCKGERRILFQSKHSRLTDDTIVMPGYSTLILE